MGDAEWRPAVTAMPPPYFRRWRLDGIVALVALAVAALAVAFADHRVPALEEWVFRAINNLPDALESPMWASQLLGVLVVPLVLAAIAAIVRRWRLALALVLLAPAKLLIEYRIIKVVADRERPATSLCHGDLSCLHLRHTPAAGVSIPSGHAIIAMGIWWLVTPYLSRRWQVATLAVCGLVLVARIYLGAHNPLDVLAGGAAGICVAAILNVIVGVPSKRDAN